MLFRCSSGACALALAAFAAVQWNDPDAAFWMPVYAAGALWCAAGAAVPRALGHPVARVLVSLSFVLAAAGTVHFWPDEPGFWHRDVWWESETAREGMGMMVLTAGLVLPLVRALVPRRSRRR